MTLWVPARPPARRRPARQLVAHVLAHMRRLRMPMGVGGWGWRAIAPRDSLFAAKTTAHNIVQG